MVKVIGAVLGVSVVAVSAAFLLMQSGGTDAAMLETDVAAPIDLSTPEPVVQPRPRFETPAVAERPERGEGRPEGRRGDRGDRGGRGGGPGGWMGQMDADGDGVVSDTEWAARWDEMQKRRAEFEADRLARFDKDGDGEISAEENYYGFQSRIKEGMSRRFDEDSDGTLNEQEQARANESFERMSSRMDERMVQGGADIDGDGVLSEAERIAASAEFMQRGMNRQREMVGRFDRDGDGNLDMDESYDAFATSSQERSQRRFLRQYDTDGDGTLGGGDLGSFMALHRAGDMKADANDDGVVDTFDVQAFQDAMLASQR